MNKLILGLLMLGTIALAGCSQTGQYDEFATCLSNEGVVMYGTDWCPHCQAQKELFGASFKEVNYVNCDLHQGECIAAGVRSYPTWIMDNERLSGTQQLFSLSQLSGCSLTPTTIQ